MVLETLTCIYRYNVQFVIIILHPKMLFCNLRFRKQKAIQASSLALLYFDVYSQGLLDNIKTKHMKTLVAKTN